MKRIVVLPAALACLPVLLTQWAAAAPKKPVNLLFIITDEQRFDALGCAGNPVVKTPNLDRMAAEGVRFERAFTACPVCSPARTTILTGHGIEATKIFGNLDIRNPDLPNLTTFDQVLLRSGYHGEYHGKYHSPYQYALEYTYPVRWVNGPRPAGCKADDSEGAALQAYEAAHVPARKLEPGELLANLYNQPYRPDPLDPAYGKTQKEVQQATCYGCLAVPAEHTMTAWTAKEGLEALERLKDGPFTLTISISPPHPPMVVAKPYYGMYPPASMPVPAAIDDPRTNSSYRKKAVEPAYRDPNLVRYMVSDYYGLVTEVDDWVGRILHRLDELGLAENTLVVFTSDHGEMLGEHGLQSKMVFYEGSVRIPLLMRLPSAIPAHTIVSAPVSHRDLYATILDYCGQPGPPSEGTSLRSLIEGKDSGKDRFVVSEWNSTSLPGFMVCDGRWKLLFGRTAEATSLDALYDLKNDPHEVNNLIGCNPDWEKHRGEAERLKGMLVGWLDQVNSPRLESVKARQITLQPEPKAAPTAPTIADKKQEKKEKKEQQNKSGGDKTDKPSTTAAKPFQDRAPLFEKIDKNHDGKISLEEYLANQADPETAKKRFDRMDANKDGFLSREEFIQAGGKSK